MDDELAALMGLFNETQQAKSSARLSERNVIELVSPCYLAPPAVCHPLWVNDSYCELMSVLAHTVLERPRPPPKP
jgi:hypothetical protein